MKRFKIWLCNVFLTVRKLLGMAKLFSQLTIDDLYNIEREIDNVVRYPGNKRFDIRANFAVIEYSNLNHNNYSSYVTALQNPVISVMITDKFEVIVFPATTLNSQLCINAVEDYLKANNFL